MNVKEIGELLQQIDADRKVVAAEIPPVEFKDVVTFERIKVTANERIFANETFYREFVKSHIGAIIPEGMDEEKQREFAKVCEEEGKTLTFDSYKLYRDIAQNAWAMMGGTGQLGVDQVALMFTEIRLKCRTEFGIFRLRDPDFDWMFQQAWRSIDELADGIRHSIFRTNGLAFTLAAIQKYVADESLARPVARTTVPVVMIGMKDEELSELQTAFSHGSVIVKLNLEGSAVSTKEAVTETFKQLKNTIKTNREKTNV